MDFDDWGTFSTWIPSFVIGHSPQRESSLSELLPILDSVAAFIRAGSVQNVSVCLPLA